MSRHLKLFIPGPGDVEEDVLEAAARPMLRHCGPEWMKMYNELLALLKQVFRTRNDLFLVPGPASALLDMAIGSLLATGQKIIVGHIGFFGERHPPAGRRPRGSAAPLFNIVRFGPLNCSFTDN